QLTAAAGSAVEHRQSSNVQSREELVGRPDQHPLEERQVGGADDRGPGSGGAARGGRSGRDPRELLEQGVQRSLWGGVERTKGRMGRLAPPAATTWGFSGLALALR
ncbi:hypothetical protein Vafri_19891, partial [Volvox africanus]